MCYTYPKYRGLNTKISSKLWKRSLHHAHQFLWSVNTQHKFEISILITSPAIKEKFVSKSVALGPKCSQADGSRTALVVECTKTEGDQPSSQLIFIQIQGIDDRPNFGVSRTDFATKKKTSKTLRSP